MNGGHIYCLHCVELMIFRVQLAIFVKNNDEENLHITWEKEYGKINFKPLMNAITEGKCCRCVPICGFVGDSDSVNSDNTDNKDDEKNETNNNDPDDDIKTEMNDTDDESTTDVTKLFAIKLLIKRLDKGANVSIPPALVHLDYTKYGVYCMSYVLSKLEKKRRDKLFMVLEFICMVQPTATTIKLINEYKKTILMFPKKHIDNMFLAVIRGSKYSICAALKMGSIAKQFGDIDLANKEKFIELSKKYEGIAVEIINTVESDHLTTILLETQSDIDDKRFEFICTYIQLICI